jgi:phosphotransferase system IIB component
LAVTNGKKRLNLTNKQEALSKTAEFEATLLAHGGQKLNDLAQLVSNGDLTNLAATLAVHGKDPR